MPVAFEYAMLGSLAEVTIGMAGLTGQIVDVPFAITANMLILQLQDTSLQNSCAEPGIMQAVSACCKALSLHSDLFRPTPGFTPYVSAQACRVITAHAMLFAYIHTAHMPHCCCGFCTH